MDVYSMEGKSNFDRIIAKSLKQRDEAFLELQAMSEKRSEDFKQYELEKTPEDLEIIEKIEKKVDRVVKEYGGDPSPISLENMHVLKPGAISAVTDGRYAFGLYRPMSSEIAVEKWKSKLLFATVLEHELFHMKSYKSARLTEGSKTIQLYRSGLSMNAKKNPDENAEQEIEYFGMLEEAIVDECSIKLGDEISHDRIFSEEAKALERLRNWVIQYQQRRGLSNETIDKFKSEFRYLGDPQEEVNKVLAYSQNEEDRQSYAAGLFDGLRAKGEVKLAERYIEREKLHKLLDILVVDSNHRFSNRDEVFTLFAQANFSGNYVTLARTVESILGKGSFRKIAEEYSFK